MPGAKIKIECDDPLLSAALMSAIARALEAEQFTNVKAKMLMAHQEFRDGHFAKKSAINEMLGETINHLLPHNYVHELIPAKAGYVDTHPPSLLANLLEHQVSALDTPILIDMEMNAPEYDNQERAFLNEVYFSSASDEDSGRRRK